MPSQLDDRTSPEVLDSGKLPKQQCTVKVTDLPTEVTEDVLTNYFENERRSKGGPVSRVDIDRDHQTCWITFESPGGR